MGAQWTGPKLGRFLGYHISSGAGDEHEHEQSRRVREWEGKHFQGVSHA